MKKTILLIVILFSILPSSLLAKWGKNPVETLYTAGIFAFGGTGYWGIISDEEIAFQEVFQGCNARKDFINIFTNANPQGKSYALVALQSLDNDLYNKYAKDFDNQNTEVIFMSGCVSYIQNSREIVKQISSKKYSKHAVIHAYKKCVSPLATQPSPSQDLPYYNSYFKE